MVFSDKGLRIQTFSGQLKRGFIENLNRYTRWGDNDEISVVSEGEPNYVSVTW